MALNLIWMPYVCVCTESKYFCKHTCIIHTLEYVIDNLITFTIHSFEIYRSNSDIYTAIERLHTPPPWRGQRLHPYRPRMESYFVKIPIARFPNEVFLLNSLVAFGSYAMAYMQV